MITLLLIGLLYTIPPSLEPQRAEVESTMAETIGLFRDQCREHQSYKQCEKALAKARIQLLDVKSFMCGKVKARGCFRNIKNIQVAYNHIDVDQILLHELCHFFGPRVGHVAGYENCQSIK